MCIRDSHNIFVHRFLSSNVSIVTKIMHRKTAKKDTVASIRLVIRLTLFRSLFSLFFASFLFIFSFFDASDISIDPSSLHFLTNIRILSPAGRKKISGS